MPRKPTAKEDAAAAKQNDEGVFLDNGDEVTDAPATTTPPADAPAAPAAEAPKPAHSKLSLRIARQYGFDDATVARLSPDELDDAIHEETLRRDGERRFHAAQRQADGFDRPPVAPAPAPAPVAEDPDADLAQYDEPLRKRLQRQATLEKRLEDAEKRLAESDKREATRTQQAVDERIEDTFNSLDDNLRAYYGNGDLGKYPAGTPEHRRIVSLLRDCIDFTKPLPGVATLKARFIAYTKDVAGHLFEAAKPAAPASDYAAAVSKEMPAEEAVDEDDLTAPVRPRGKDGRFTDKQWERGGMVAPTARRAVTPAKGDAAFIAEWRRIQNENDLAERNGEHAVADDAP